MPALANGLGLSRTRFSGGGVAPNSSEAQQFYDRLLTPPTTAREAIYNALIDGLVTDGVWAKLDVLNVACAFDEATALENLIQLSYQSAREQSAGAATFTVDAGWSAGSILRRVTTNFNPSTAVSPKFTQNDGMVMAWIYSTAQINQNALGVGVAGVDSGSIEIYPKYSDNKVYANLNGTEFGPTAGADSSGCFIVQRTASNAAAIYRNDTLLGSDTSASAAVTNANIFLRCEHSTRAYAVGASLSAGERTALYNRLATFITAVTGGVP